MGTFTVKPLTEMTAEIVANNTRLGWYENTAKLPEALALLHSEVSEALEAWRESGLEDKTLIGGINPADGELKLAKPEGVGSEFADILIRLLDDAYLFGGWDLEKQAANVCGMAFGGSFSADMNKLHDLISQVSWASNEPDYEPIIPAGDRMAAVLVYLHQLCMLYGIDLEAEYERKMAYNRTRPYRHGGKAI